MWCCCCCASVKIYMGNFSRLILLIMVTRCYVGRGNFKRKSRFIYNSWITAPRGENAKTTLAIIKLTPVRQIWHRRARLSFYIDGIYDELTSQCPRRPTSLFWLTKTVKLCVMLLFLCHRLTAVRSSSFLLHQSGLGKSHTQVHFRFLDVWACSDVFRIFRMVIRLLVN